MCLWIAARGAAAQASEAPPAGAAATGTDTLRGVEIATVDPAPAGSQEDATPVADIGPRTAGSDLAGQLWLPRSMLRPERADRVPEYCAGAYRELTYPLPRSVDSGTRPIGTRSDRASYHVDGDIELDGDVRIEQGNRRLEADRAVLDQTTRDGVATGTVRVREPGLVMQGERATVNMDSGAAALDDVQFVLLDRSLRGTARHMAQDQAGTLYITRGSFTRCEPGNGSWRLGAAEVEVEEGEVFGTARHAVLRAGGIPLFYTPYIRFPVTDDRQSGWMFPNLAHSDEDGADISVPYYLNLAPNYDATLLPRYIERRGMGLEGEFRHLSAWEETTLTGAILPDDDRYDGEYERDDFEDLVEAGELSGEFDPADRWLYGMRHDGELGPFRTLVDYTAASDRDYFRDLGSDLGVSSQIELERRGEIQYSSGGLFMRLWGQRFQRLDENPTDPYQRLPELEMLYSGDLPGPLEWSLGAEYVTFDRDNDDLSGINAIVGDRAHVEPRLRLPLSAAWGFLTLTGGYRYTSYDLRDVPVGVEAQPDRKIGLGSAHAGLFFERELDWFGASLVQTLEPQVYYLYQEYADQAELPRFDVSQLTFGFRQLFRDNRFSGLDRIGDANQLSVGLTTRFVDAVSGREYLRASLGEIVYFEDRQVTLAGSPGPDEMQPTSALAGELGARIARHWSLSGSVVWDHNDDDVEEIGAGLQYQRDNRHIVNLGYRKRVQDDIDQTDVSVYWPVTRHYAVIGRWNYDLVSGRTIEGFGGIEYNDCCWRIRLMARRFLDSPTGRNLENVEADEGIFLQVVFKGLAGFGSKMESVMQRGIRGYTMEDANAYQ